MSNDVRAESDTFIYLRISILSQFVSLSNIFAVLYNPLFGFHLKPSFDSGFLYIHMRIKSIEIDVRHGSTVEILFSKIKMLYAP